ncbi:unnamed protein product, partial [Allacma fusca]
VPPSPPPAPLEKFQEPPVPAPGARPKKGYPPGGSCPPAPPPEVEEGGLEPSPPVI